MSIGSRDKVSEFNFDAWDLFLQLSYERIWACLLLHTGITPLGWITDLIMRYSSSLNESWFSFPSLSIISSNISLLLRLISFCLLLFSLLSFSWELLNKVVWLSMASPLERPFAESEDCYFHGARLCGCYTLVWVMSILVIVGMLAWFNYLKYILSTFLVSCLYTWCGD